MKDFLFKLCNPLRAVAKRWGPTPLKQAAWHIEYKRGKHLHDLRRHGRSRICDKVEQYANGGDILDLGCSDGHVGFGLDPDKYRTYTGVDVSKIAVTRAQAGCCMMGGKRAAKNRFQVDDISKHVPTKPVDVVLFKDSLYYVKKSKMLSVLIHLKSFLTQRGVFIVQMDDIARHSWVRDLVREHFTMVEDHESREADYMFLVFR